MYDVCAKYVALSPHQTCDAICVPDICIKYVPSPHPQVILASTLHRRRKVIIPGGAQLNYFIKRTQIEI